MQEPLGQNSEPPGQAAPGASQRAALRTEWRRWDGFLALGFGSGLAPVAPGTFGTLAAVPLAWALKSLPLAGFFATLIAALVLGAWVCDRVGKRLGAADHGAIVWDEFVGYWLAIALVPPHWGWLLAGFVVFRCFDILKPWPISLVDRKIHGGWGVMLDDVLAGAFTLLVLWGAEALIGPIQSAF